MNPVDASDVRKIDSSSTLVRQHCNQRICAERRPAWFQS